MRRLLQVALVTTGDPSRLTGGHLYNRRMAARAGRHGARLAIVPVWSLGPGLPLATGPGWLRSSEVRDTDVLVLDSLAAAAVAPWLGAIRVPIVGLLHQPPGGVDSQGLVRRLLAPLDRWAYRRCCLLIAASSWLAEELAQTDIAERPITIIPPGRDPAGPGEAAEPNQPADQTPSSRDRELRHGRRASALCVTNWLPQKGILGLLDAIASLPADLVTLHLVGNRDADRGHARRIDARLDKPDLRNRVVVHGQLEPPAVADLYRAADLFVLPSWAETYGTVWAEAMAAGLPVVGWRSGNLPFLAEHEREGLLVPPGDIAVLSQSIERLARDEALRQRMGHAAQVRATATFPTWDETAARFFEAVREVHEARAVG